MSDRTQGGLRPWLELIRLPAAFTAPADVIAGLALGVAATGRWPDFAPSMALILVSVALYASGMASNDLFDRRIDAQERPGRPIPSGRIAVREAWAVVLGLQVFALLLAASAGAASLLIAAALLGAIYFYNAWAKHFAFGPWAMGLCRYLSAALGLSLTMEASGVWWALPVATLVFVAGVTGVSRHEVEGASLRALRWPSGLMVAGALVPVGAGLAGALHLPGAAIMGLVLAIWLAPALGQAWLEGSPQNLKKLVKAGIFGIALLNAAFVAGTPAWPFAAVILALLVAGRRVGRWFYAT